MCVALYIQYFPESCEKNHRHFTRVRFKPTTLGKTPPPKKKKNKNNNNNNNNKLNILYPRCKFNIYRIHNVVKRLDLAY